MPPYFDEEEALLKQEPEDAFEPISSKELDKRTQTQMKDFGNLLNSLDKTLDKKKQLWKLIFENSITDRKNAYLVFADLYVAVHSRPAEHAIHGQTLSKYMERMSKATDQLLKLAELVAAAEDKVPVEDTDQLTDDEIYSSITKQKDRH